LTDICAIDSAGKTSRISAGRMDRFQVFKGIICSVAGMGEIAMVWRLDLMEATIYSVGETFISNGPPSL